MFFPKCPRCGGKSKSAESDTISYANRHVKRLASGNLTGHAHPLLGMVGTAITVGNMVYQRLPGCGRKRCTDCGHEFS